jgi:Leucine-rich repeat (LRR) protein
MGCCKSKASEVAEPGSRKPGESGVTQKPGAGPSEEVLQKKIAQAKKTGVLAFRECNLKVLPPAAVTSDASTIRTVDLTCNSLNSLPESIGAWTGLQSCLCEQAGLTALPAAIGKLAKLEKLGLSSNKLRTLPVELSQLGKLRILQLCGNQLGPKLPEAIFTGELAKALAELELSDNVLEELPATLGGLSSLVRLLVANNKLRELPAALGGAAKLQHLVASDNLLTSVPSALLEGTNLSELWLKGNQIDRLQLQEMPGFAAFLERRKLRIDHKIEANVVGKIDLAVCGLD